MARSYKDLIAWRKSMELVAEIYKATQKFPKEELYGITSQLRRAAVSVPSNIAEGQARLSPKEFRKFLSDARGSLVEIETQLMISQMLKFLSNEDSERLLNRTCELARILNGLLASIKAIVESPASLKTGNSQLTTEN